LKTKTFWEQNNSISRDIISSPKYTGAKSVIKSGKSVIKENTYIPIYTDEN